MSNSILAKKTALSGSTVSRFRNGRGGVSAESAERLRHAMEELDIPRTPQRHHRSSPKRIAVCAVGDSFGLHFERLLLGISEAATAHSISVMLNVVADPSELPYRVSKGKVDGLIVLGHPAGLPLQDLKDLRIVWLMGDVRRPSFGDEVMPDHRQIGELATRHLLRRGHRQLGVVEACGGTNRLRMLGFCLAAEEAGVSVEIIRGNDGKPTASGIFATDEKTCATLLSSLSSSSRGSSNVELVSCEAPVPRDQQWAHATIDVRPQLLGYRAVEQLLWRLQNRTISEQIRVLVEPALVLSSSREASSAHNSTETTNPQIALCGKDRRRRAVVAANS